MKNLLRALRFWRSSQCSQLVPGAIAECQILSTSLSPAPCQASVHELDPASRTTQTPCFSRQDSTED